MTAPIHPPSGVALLPLLTAPSGIGAGGGTSLAAGAFRQIVLEALAEQARRGPPAGEAPAAAEPVAAAPTPPDGSPRAPIEGGRPGAESPSHEAVAIQREAERTGVDPGLLRALRRTENGGPGREFGVLSVPAPTLEAQARIAANSIANSMARFERQGGQPINRSTGRYTEEFLRFFSARYAPQGAGNDLAGLNRVHAANLIRHYRNSGGNREG